MCVCIYSRRENRISVELKDGKEKKMEKFPSHVARAAVLETLFICLFFVRAHFSAKIKFSFDGSA